MAVTFNGEILSVLVKTKKTKVKDGDTTFEEVEKIGRMTIEFNGDAVDVTALAELTNGRDITLALNNTQRSFLTNVDQATGEITR